MTITLLDFHKAEPIRYLWVCGHRDPARMVWEYDVECGELDVSDTTLRVLRGTVDQTGAWRWDGIGRAFDLSGREYASVVARRSADWQRRLKNKDNGHG